MALTAKMRKAIEYLVYTDLTDIELCEQIGMSTTTLWRMRKNEEFQEALSAECKHKFRSIEQLAIKKLQENVEKNNQKAIEYTLDYLGYKAADNIDVDMTANIVVDYGDGDEDSAQ